MARWIRTVTADMLFEEAYEAYEWHTGPAAGMDRCDVVQELAGCIALDLHLSEVDASVYVGHLIVWGLLSSDEGEGVLSEAVRLTADPCEGCGEPSPDGPWCSSECADYHTD